MGIPMSIEPQHLLLLLNWMSPAFPIGSFAYSHGLEWAVESGTVRTAADLEGWISDLIARGSGWNDAVLFSRCWHDEPAELNELALALATSSGRHLETTQLGRAFLLAASAWRSAAPVIAGEIAYPVAAGLCCHAAGIAKTHGLLAYLQGFSNTLVSVAVRLVPLGQRRGLEVTRDLMPVITAAAGCAAAATRDDFGTTTIAADISAMKHETQHSRVFRT
jgi:urease accessory protein